MSHGDNNYIYNIDYWLLLNLNIHCYIHTSSLGEMKYYNNMITDKMN